MNFRIPNIKNKIKLKPVYFTPILFIILLSALIYIFYPRYQKIQTDLLNKQTLEEQLKSVEEELIKIKNEDQYLKNETLQKEIVDINEAYKKAITQYENLLDLKIKIKDTENLDKLFVSTLSLLSDRKYDEAITKLNELAGGIKEENDKLAVKEVAQIATANVPTSNTPPGSGYSRQTVATDTGNFTVSLIAADISSTRVIVDTASDSTCTNDCPVLSLADYVSRNGAYAGVNGSYFCPADYPSCSGKTNSFDLLLMNKNKTYFNSDNNVYSNNPGVVFGGGYVRFLSAVSQWGRDTSIDGMISNYPLLVSAGNITFGGDDDPKKGSKGNRSFVADKQGKVFIGVVHSATVAESARVMKAMEMDNALNLDDGGSTALWSGGYKVGPGRSLPNAILFINK